MSNNTSDKQTKSIQNNSEVQEQLPVENIPSEGERSETEENPSDEPGGTKFIFENDSLKEEVKKDSEIHEKRGGRRKIQIEFIENKSRRHVTFSKRKAGLIKKAYELSTLTGTQVLLLVASETGNVYTFATPKLQPLITKPEGKTLIQSCLNPPEIGEIPSAPNNLHQQRMGNQEANIYSDREKKVQLPVYNDPTRYHKDLKSIPSNGLSELNSFSGGYVHGLNTISQNSAPMYSYPMTMGGFVPPQTHSRYPQSSYNSYVHQTSNQYHGQIPPSSNPYTTPPYLYTPGSSSQFSQDSSKDLV